MICNHLFYNFVITPKGVSLIYDHSDKYLQSIYDEIEGVLDVYSFSELSFNY